MTTKSLPQYYTHYSPSLPQYYTHYSPSLPQYTLLLTPSVLYTLLSLNLAGARTEITQPSTASDGLI